MKLSRSAWIWPAFWFGCAIIATSVSGTHDPAPHVLSRMLRPMEWGHPLGFDAFGRDLFEITLRASMVSCGFGAVATLLACMIGAITGTTIAICPRPLRSVFLRSLDFLLAFPYLLFAIAWATVRGPGWITLFVALLIGTVPSLTRLVYVRAREVLREDFILAAQSLGASPIRILKAHLLPSVISLVLVKAPNLFAHALIAEATLSFLGIGAPIGRETWGSLLVQAKDYLIEAPHLAWGVGAPLVLTVLSLQIISEKLNPAPRSN